jgi:hypothetical protein
VRWALREILTNKGLSKPKGRASLRNYDLVKVAI